MKKFTEETINKRKKNLIENNDKKEMEKQALINEIQEKSKSLLLPNLKEKVIDTTNKIVEILKNLVDYLYLRLLLI